MAITVLPYIPASITVHLGPPDSPAENVTVPFPDYIKNVASSEVYPTWQPSALRANILAQVSFALNRVYTEYYRSRGYSFDITNTTAYDQRFINGRNTFENVDAMVDQLYTTYIRREGYAEPLAAHFCNGTTTTCDGLTQWGSQELAEAGYNSVEILETYYGNDIQLVTGAPTREIQPSWPGAPLQAGDQSAEVLVAQVMLNRIARTYPAIPRPLDADGVFGAATRTAVRQFQQIFDLPATGIIDRATWYKLVMLYTGILRLAELDSLGQQFFRLNFRFRHVISFGTAGEEAALLQYLLAILSQFYLSLPNVAIDGVFGSETLAAVKALQQDAGLEQTGVVDQATWEEIIRRYIGIDRAVLSTGEYFDFQSAGGTVSPQVLQDILAADPGRFPGVPLALGQQD